MVVATFIRSHRRLAALTTVAALAVGGIAAGGTAAGAAPQPYTMTIPVGRAMCDPTFNHRSISVVANMVPTPGLASQYVAFRIWYRPTDGQTAWSQTTWSPTTLARAGSPVAVAAVAATALTAPRWSTTWQVYAEGAWYLNGKWSYAGFYVPQFSQVTTNNTGAGNTYLSTMCLS